MAGGTAQTVTLTSSDNTLAGLEGAINGANLGVTASIVTNSDGSSSLSLSSGTNGSLAVTSNITDTTNSLAYTSPVTGVNANLTVDGVALTSASNTVANLIPGVTFQLTAPSTSGEQVQVIIGNDNAGVESTVNQFVSDYNSLISAVNTQEGNTSSGTPEPLFGSPTLSLLQQQLLGGLNVANPTGSLTAIATNAGTTLSGSLTIAVGGGTAQTITLTSSDNTLAGLASAINSAQLGVTANVVTTGGQSTLSFHSQDVGSSGALTVTSTVVASTPSALSYSDSGYTGTTADTGTLTSIANAGDALSGSISIAVAGGAATTVSVPANSASSPSNNLAGLAGAINAANIGVTAAVVTANGRSSLQLTSGTLGSAGALTVTSGVLDTGSPTTASQSYTSSSDLGSLTGLGISVNNDGTLTFDATSLDSVLNSDYSGVVGFFQSANGWGQNFNTMLTNSGTAAGTGILALASSSNSSIESTLNADISKENSLISAQQISLTNELNSANEIMQQLPSQLDGVNELYSAITGYNQNSNA